MRRLYSQLLPALSSKEKSLHNEGYMLITKKDIFNYLEENWDRNSDISDMVDDIMNVDGYCISKNIKNEKLYRRDFYEEEY